MAVGNERGVVTNLCEGWGLLFPNALSRAGQDIKLKRNKPKEMYFIVFFATNPLIKKKSVKI